MDEPTKLLEELKQMARSAEGCAASPMDGETATDVYRYTARRLRKLIEQQKGPE